MILMALDHVRGFLTEARFNPLDLTRTTIPLFLTRWVTHTCAPVFVLLAGTGAYLSARPNLSRFLFTRGLWLVFLELTVIHLSWTFRLDFHSISGGVIWAIGWSMVALAGLARLPAWALTLFGVSMMALHNLFDGLAPADFGSAGWIWAVFHVPSSVPVAAGFTLWTAYPLIPWIVVMAAGYGVGALLQQQSPSRRRRLLILGVTLTLLFVALRWSNAYADPDKWSPQSDPAFTVLSFLRCRKYPPSLCYLLMTLGPSLVFLAAADRPVPRWLRPVLVFGRVPLFFYLVHIPLIHAVSIGMKRLFLGPPPEPGAPYGFGLAVVYATTIAVALLLYFPCERYAELKKGRAWLRYL